MKHILLFFACLFACGACFAQKMTSVSGQITNDKNERLAYAVVRLVKQTDTSQKKTVQSGFDGKYQLLDVSEGNYLLSISLVGYKKQSMAITVKNEDLVIPDVIMANDAQTLKQVTVQALKPFIEQRIDKTVLNVENSLVATGGSVLDVLEKAPGVVVDKQNDQIKLNNKSGITVMIDGRTNFLSGADVTTLLSNMSSDQVATIELITNPSSKYDASGNAGIINIKLKKNKNMGTNGTLSLQGAEAIMPNMPKQAYRAGVNLNLNHRVSKWNYFGGLAYAGKANASIIAVDRMSAANKFNQNFERSNEGTGYQAKGGIDYFANTKTVFGLMLDANTIGVKLNNSSLTNMTGFESGNPNNQRVLQQTNATTPANNFTANLNMKRDFGNDGKNFTVDMDYAGFSSKNDENFDANFFNNAGQNNQNTYLRNNTERLVDVFALKSDIALPLSKTFKIETGIKSSYVSTQNNFLAEELVNNNWQKNLGRSNNFRYQENINALYISSSKEWKKWGLQLGLRAEQTNSTGELITTNNKVDRSYISLFPTAYLEQKLNKVNSIRYGYSRRVDRPNYQQLNPFLFYMDPYAVEQGNPYLTPQFTNNFEINYSYKEFGISLNYADTRDMITQSTTQDDATGIVKVMRFNLGRSQNYALNLSAPFKVTKFWRVQNNISTYYNKIDDDNLVKGYSASKVAMSFNSSQSFTISKTFSAELSFWLNTPRINGVEQTTVTQYAFNIGLQKLMLNKKMKMRFALDDVFLNNYWAGRLQYDNVNMTVVSRYTSRRAMLSLNYSFGNENVKSARNRKTATDDIKNRAGEN